MNRFFHGAITGKEILKHVVALVAALDCILFNTTLIIPNATYVIKCIVTHKRHLYYYYIFFLKKKDGYNDSLVQGITIGIRHALVRAFCIGIMTTWHISVKPFGESPLIRGDPRIRCGMKGAHRLI